MRTAMTSSRQVRICEPMFSPDVPPTAVFESGYTVDNGAKPHEAKFYLAKVEIGKAIGEVLKARGKVRHDRTSLSPPRLSPAEFDSTMFGYARRGQEPTGSRPLSARPAGGAALQRRVKSSKACVR